MFFINKIKKNIYIFVFVFVVCVISSLSIISHAESSDSDSSDLKQTKYIDDFSVSDDNRYIYTIRNRFIIRYDTLKNKTKKLIKLPEGYTYGCMLMGENIVFGIEQWYTETSLKSKNSLFRSSYVYKFNIKSKELEVISHARFEGIDEAKNKIFCFNNTIGAFSVDINGIVKENDYADREGSFIISKKRKGISVKETKSYHGSYKDRLIKSKKGTKRYKRIYEKWKADNNNIVLKTSGKKVTVAKNAFIISKVYKDQVFYLNNCIVIFYYKYSKYNYRYDFLSLGESAQHMMIISYDGKHKKKIY